MTKIANTRKDFNFSIEINGINQFLIQKVTPPEQSMGVVEHGADGKSGNTKTPGKLKIGDLIVEKICPSTEADKWAQTWFEKAKNGLRSQYAKYAVLHELDETRTFPIASWDLGEIWPYKIGRTAYDRNAENNITETVTFAVDRYTLR
jgi:phage tail-like protein